MYSWWRSIWGMMILMPLMLTGYLMPLYGQNLRPVPYNEGMERMAEILGSLHYLDNLCNTSSDEWLRFMDRMILADHPTSSVRTRLIVAFNRSYQAFADHYHQCTQAADEAMKLYRREGAELANELVNRYGR